MQKPSKVGELAYIIIDCQDNLRVATFWSNILGLELETDASPPYIDLVQPHHGGPKLSFQQVEEPKATKKPIAYGYTSSRLAGRNRADYCTRRSTDPRMHRTTLHMAGNGRPRGQ